MSLPADAVVSMGVLALGGALPVLALCGALWRSVLLAPLAGAVIAGLAAAGCLAIGGGLEGWFISLSAIGSAAAGAFWIWKPERRPWYRARDGARASMAVNGIGVVAALGALAAAGFSLVALRAPWVGFDARGIWMLHAVWFADGHHSALVALRSGTMPFAHPSYPPLIGGSVALAWQVTGDHSYRLGSVIVACLNAACVLAVGWALFEVGRRAAAGAKKAREVVATSVSAAASVLVVFAAFGVAGPFATNGYADLLWSAAAVGAIAYGLVMPPFGGSVGAAAVLLAVAGLTKDEGIAIGMVVVVLIAARRVSGADRRRWPILAGVVGVGFLGAWPVLVRLLGVHGDVPNVGSTTDRVTRVRLTFDAIVPHLHVVLLAVPLSVIGTLVATAARRAAGVGNDLWSWGAIAIGTALIGGVYVTGPGNVEFWLFTSVHRTTIFTAIGVWWEVGVWTTLCTAAFARGRERSVASMERGQVLETGPLPAI